MTQKGGLAAKIVMCLTKIFLCTFSETQYFLLGSSWSSDITASDKKTSSKSL